MRTEPDDQPHECCWHAYEGPSMVVLEDGHILQKCCKCPATRTIHKDHAHESSRRQWQLNHQS